MINRGLLRGLDSLLGMASFAILPSISIPAQGLGELEVTETEGEIQVRTSLLEATVRTKDYVKGVAGGSFLDRRTGCRDAGFGLDIVDWIMEPGSNEAYRDRLPGDLAYEFNNLVHGKIPKRSIEVKQADLYGFQFLAV